MTQTINDNLVVTGTTTLASPARITSLPQNAIDQAGVLNLAHVGLHDVAYVDDVVQNALDAIANRIAQGKGGATLLFPMGSTSHFQRGVSFGADGPLSIIGGTGFNKKAAKLVQMPGCNTLFNLTNTNESGSLMNVEIGGFAVDGHQPGATFAKVHNPEALFIHDIKAAAGAGYWNEFFNLRNIRGCSFERMYLRNDHGGMDPNDWRGSAFVISSSQGSTGHNFDSIMTQGWDVAVNAVSDSHPGIEGMLFTGCGLSGKYGIIWVYNGADTSYLPPQLQYVNGHMNCQKSWLVADRVAQILVMGNTLELHGDFGYGDSGMVLTNVGGFDVSHNKMMVAGNTARAAMVIGSGTFYGQISHITGTFAGSKPGGAGIHFLAGSANCSMDNVEVHTFGGEIYAAGPNQGHRFDNASIRKV